MRHRGESSVLAAGLRLDFGLAVEVKDARHRLVLEHRASKAAKVFLRGVMPTLAVIGAVTGPYVLAQGPVEMHPVGWFFLGLAALSVLLSLIPLKTCRLELGP